MDIDMQRFRIDHASRDQLIKLVEIQGLRKEVEEQFDDFPNYTLETVRLFEFQAVMMGSWEPENVDEGLECLVRCGIINSKY